ncbi:hypothetical protein OPQ81_008535 [Rhizoctonia solani]|nr:hypothetical protein OPQ81_008535 [Rhizoctonia solani]
MSGSAGSRAVSGASKTTGSGGSIRQGHSEDEGQDHTFGVGTSMWRRGTTPLRQRHDSGEPEPPVPELPDPEPTSSSSTTQGTSTHPFPRHSIATSSTSANPEVSTVAGSFVTAPPSFVSASETEHEWDQ